MFKKNTPNKSRRWSSDFQPVESLYSGIGVLRNNVLRTSSYLPKRATPIAHQLLHLSIAFHHGLMANMMEWMGLVAGLPATGDVNDTAEC